MKNKLSFLLVSLMCVVGCDVANTSSSTSGTNNQSSQTSTGNSNSSSVVEYQFALNNLESKSTFVDYNEYKAEQTNKEDEFMDRTVNYQVGDDNNFGFKPQLTLARRNVTTGNVDFVYNAEWEYVVNLYRLEGETFNKVDLDTYAESFDTTECLINFNEEAIGETFKISLYPTKLSESQMQELETKWQKDLVVDVVDGYNVTDAKELAYVQNNTEDMRSIGSLPTTNYKTIWDEFKVANNLEVDYEPTSLILHNNIEITKDDIPAKYFFDDTEVAKSDSDYDRVIGSLKDYLSIYYRKVEAGENFTLEGNYFSLNADAVPTVVRPNNEIENEIDNKLISHATLFRFEGDADQHIALQNIKLIGNSPRKENESLSGGLIMNKVEGPSFTAYNNIAIRWFISYFPNKTFSPYLVDKCRAYNNFNSFIYSWGSTDVTLRDSEMKVAGGPVIIQDHIDIENGDPATGTRSNTKIENCVLESIVSGTEGWFSIVKAVALVPTIKSLDTVFNYGGRTFLKNVNEVQLLNLISVNKDGSAETITPNPAIRGSVSIDNYTFGYGENGATNPYFGQFYSTIMGVNSAAPIFETNAGGMAYFNGEGLIDGTNKNITGNANDNIHKGDNLCIYYSGMQIVFGYYPLEA